MKKLNALKFRRKLLCQQLIAVFGLSIGMGTAFAATCTTSGTIISCTGSYTLWNTDFAGYDQVKIDLQGNYNLSGPQGIGYYQNGGNNTINASNVEIFTKGSAADGIRTNGSATLTFNGKLTVKAQGSSGDGINVANSNRSASTVYVNSEGAYIESKGGVGIRTNLTQSGNGNNAYIAKNARVVTIGAGSNSTSGTGYAVYAGDRDYDTVLLPAIATAKIVMSEGSTINTSGNEAHAVYANKTGVIELGSTQIMTSGTGAHGIVAQDGKVTYCSGGLLNCILYPGNYQSQNYDGGQVYLTGDTQITVDASKGSYAMYVSGQDAKITSRSMAGVLKPGVYTVTGDLLADRAGQIELHTIGASNLNSNISAMNANSLIALNLAGTSQIIGNYNAQDSGTINLTYGDHTIANGDMTTDATGVITANFSDKVHYTGTVDASAGGPISMNFSSIDAKWQMLGNSHVTNLHFNNDGQVILGDTTDPTNTNRVDLTIENLSGDGYFYVRSDLARDGNASLNDGDKIYVTNSSSGNHKVYVRDANLGGVSIATTGDEKLRIVEDSSGGSATFTLGGDAGTGVEQTYVDVGAYQYILDKEDNTTVAPTNYWTLSAAKTPVAPGGGVKPLQPLLPLPPLTNAAQGSVNILNANYLMSHVETQTLLQRMGQLRQRDAQGGDAWGRVYGGKLNSFSDARLAGFDMSYSGMQLGLDRQLDIERGNVYIGAMAGMGKGDVDYAVGSGSTKSYHVGVYGTYQHENGFYIDGIIKYVHMNNKFDTLTGGGYPVSGHGNTKGVSIGVEVGKRFYVQQTDQGWYIEPQGQLTYSHQSGTTVNASNGLRTDLHSYNSVLARASIIAGYSVVKGENPIDVYVKTGYVKELDGKTGYTFNYFDKEQYDFGGGWWDNGVGINMQINGKHNLYLEGNYAKGGKFDRKQINVGYRYSF